MGRKRPAVPARPLRSSRPPFGPARTLRPVGPARNATPNRPPGPTGPAGPAGRHVPILRNVNNNFVKPVVAQQQPPVCGLNKNGMRGAAFQKCFVKHLQTLVAPSFKRGTNALGNAGKMNALCKQSTLSPHQTVLYEMAKLMSVVPAGKLGGHRGLLAYHGTGSGKSLSSLAIIMAFWRSGKKIVLVSTRVNADQAIATYKREAAKFFPREFKRIVSEYKSAKHSNHLTDKEAFNAALDARVTGMSFRMARNRIAARTGEFSTIKEIPLYADAGSVLVIDEAQGLAQKSKADPLGDAIRLGCALRNLSPEKMRKIHVFAMTATPGNTIKEWLKLLSIVRRTDQPAFASDSGMGSNKQGRALCESRPGARDDTNAVRGLVSKAMHGNAAALASLQKYVHANFFGLVSYVDIRSDLSRHACVETVTQKVPLDRYYFLLMIKMSAVLRREVKTAADRAQFVYDPQFPDAFFKKMRLAGNSLPKTMWGSLPKDVQETLVSHHRILKVPGTRGDGRLVSPKFIKVAEQLAKPGKQYAYSSSGGEFLLAAGLRQWYGMHDVTRLAETFNSARVTNDGKIVGIKPGKNFIVLNDTIKKDHKNRLTEIFNSPANNDGSYIRVVIASGGLYEGLDLKGLRYVNLADTLPSASQEIQAIGRGARNCSHSGLALANRRVTVIRWASTAPAGDWAGIARLIPGVKGMKGRVGPEQMKDEYSKLGGLAFDDFVAKRTRTDPEFVLLQNFERVIQSQAIDCQVLSRYHGGGSSCGKPVMSSSVTMSAGKSCPKSS